jgi:hypothetical protein
VGLAINKESLCRGKSAHKAKILARQFSYKGTTFRLSLLEMSENYVESDLMSRKVRLCCLTLG